MDKCENCGEEMQSFMTHKCRPDLFKDIMIYDNPKDWPIDSSITRNQSEGNDGKD